MREIKFRQAIFEGGKFLRFHYWGFVGYKHEFIGPIKISGINCQYDIKKSDQHIGLKDKNNKSIFEKDIYKEGRQLLQVIFSSGSFMGDYANGSSLRFIAYEDIEIIGNVHESIDFAKAT